MSICQTVAQEIFFPKSLRPWQLAPPEECPSAENLVDCTLCPKSEKELMTRKILDR